MKSRLTRLWPLTLCLLLLFALSHATAKGVQSDGKPKSPSVHQNQKPLQDEAALAPDIAANREAQNILHKLHRSSRRPSRFTKPSGMIGTILYYLKELFFLLFFKNNTVSEPSSSTSASPKKLSEPLASAVRLLNDAADLDNVDAIYTLAELNFYGKYGHPRNLTRAFDEYAYLSGLNGNSSAQHMVGFMYATGLGNVVERDQARAMLYHQYAADGGDTRSQMTMGFRHHAGISTPRNCEKAMRYYKKVAEKAMQWARSGPPGGRQVEKHAFRFAEDEGGIFGEGASVSSSGRNAKHGGPNTDAHAAFDDVMEYLDLMSRKGEIKATFGLARLHYEGSRNLPQDYKAARKFFSDIARRYWTVDGKTKQDVEPGVERLAAKAAGYIGRMYLRGEGVEQDFKKALVWFRRGVALADALSQYSIGLMHLFGHSVTKDPVLAANFFGMAADQDFASAQVRLGALLMDQGDLLVALKYFDIASHHGHIEAYYYLAEIANLGTAQQERSCSTATLYYKTVAEKAELIHSNFGDANAAYENGDFDTALIGYMQAAEQGYEIGQSNVAFLLDKPFRAAGSHLPSLWSLFNAPKRLTGLYYDAKLALIYWTRSARQANIDSLVKMGDYYLRGLGTPIVPGNSANNSLSSERNVNAEKAAVCYSTAAETLSSAQALWNLGWMHENGLGGLVQDFHLAKRFYDQSLETNAEAYLPVTLALTKLRMRSYWNRLTGGSALSIRPEEDANDARRRAFSWTEWFRTFLEADLEQYEDGLRAPRGDQQPVGADDNDEWGAMGAAALGAGRDHLPGNDDFYGDELDLGLDDALVEMLAIMALTAVLGALLYYRQIQAARQRAREEAERRGDQQQPPEQRDDGNRAAFPPPAGDPAFNAWAAPGGVGH